MQKKNGKTTISPLLTFDLKVGFTFSVLSILHVRHKWLLIIVSTAVRDNMKNHQFKAG